MLLIYHVFTSAAVGQVIYVSPAAMGSGTSWSDASGDLKGVLDAASYGDEIWVEEGTYYPWSCTACTATDRDQSFVINDGVQVYGGFNGWESSLDQRDWKSNTTILSGDINQDGQLDSNSYSVIYTLNASAATLLDGFTISDGSASSSSGSNASRLRSGGGWYNEATSFSSPVIRNVTFTNNFAISGGGALLNDGSNNNNASPIIENCKFIDNECLQNGGAIFNDANLSGESSPQIIDCLFQNNKAKYGAGVYNSGISGTSNSSIIRCSFISNEATAYSGAIYNFGKSGGLSAPLIYNCLFYQNTASSAGAIYSLGSGGTATPQITNCTFFGNHANTGGAVYCNESATNSVTEATITNSIFWENTAGFDPTFHMSGSGSPKIILNHSLVDANDCASIMFLGPADTLICNADVIYNQYPMFADTANLNFRLQALSPVINEGDNNVVNSNNIFLDMDSHIRVHNGAVDFGVYEYGSQPYVAPIITQQPLDQNNCEGDDTNFSITVEGTTPISYQWFKNDVAISGETDTVLSLSSITNSNAGTYSCRAISIFSDTVISNNASLQVDDLLDLTIDISATTTSICAGGNISFTANTTNEGSSPLYEWKIEGEVVYSGGAVFSTSTLNDNDVVSCRLTSSEACVSPTSINSDDLLINVDPILEPTIEVMASATQICAGEEIVFTSSLTNGGVTPNYEWTVNGVTVGTNNSTFTSSSLQNNDLVVCQLMSSEACASPSTVNSNSTTIAVEDVVTPALTISASITQICAGSPIDFTASPVNGGSTPVYQWTVNGQIVGSNSATFSSSTLSDGAEVSCNMTSSVSCVSGGEASSNTIEIEVTPISEPDVTISADAVDVCAGDLVSFTATVTNGGANPSFQWFVNGENQWTNNQVFSTNNLPDDAKVYCRLISSMDCVEPAIVESEELMIAVSEIVQPTVSIVSGDTVICSGDLVEFVAATNNAGASPVYEWKVNGQSVGTNSSIFTSSTLDDGAEVLCQITSSENCAVPATVSSNMVAMMVLPLVQPSIEITADVTSICAGELVTITANNTYPGSNPVFEWVVNGQVQSTTGEVFTSTTLEDASNISCTMISSETCVNESTVTSNTVLLNVADVITPSIVIESNAEMYCMSDTVVFNAVSINGGANPSYEWLADGAVVGSNSNTYIGIALEDGIEVQCMLTSDSECASPAQVQSNSVALQINDLLAPFVSIEADATQICEGDLVAFEANIVNGGTDPIYQWLVNGMSVGINTNSYLSDILNDSDIISCVLTSSEACVTTPTVGSDSIYMNVVENLELSAMVTASDSIICLGDTVTFMVNTEHAGDVPYYQWMLNAQEVGFNDPLFESANLQDQDEVSCIVTSSEVCLIENDIMADPMVVGVDSCTVSSTRPSLDTKLISIAPNPTSSLLFINSEYIIEPLNLILSDAQGRVLLQKNIDSILLNNSYQLDLSSFSSGIYFINLTSMQAVYHFKIILKK